MDKIDKTLALDRIHGFHLKHVLGLSSIFILFNLFGQSYKMTVIYYLLILLVLSFDVLSGVLEKRSYTKYLPLNYIKLEFSRFYFKAIISGGMLLFFTPGKLVTLISMGCGLFLFTIYLVLKIKFKTKTI